MADVDRAKDDIQDILNTHEYQVYYEDNRNIIQVWWDRFLQWLDDVLAEFSPTSASGDFANIAVFIVISAAIVLLGLVVFLVVRNVKRKRTFRDISPLEGTREKNWSYDDHRREARRQEANENFDLATRHLFLALLLYFHEKEWLRARKWKTNWEYYAELRSVNRQYAETFIELASIFDEVVYGERTLQKNAYWHFRSEVMTWLRENDHGEMAESVREV